MLTTNLLTCSQRNTTQTMPSEMNINLNCLSLRLIVLEILLCSRWHRKCKLNASSDHCSIISSSNMIALVSFVSTGTFTDVFPPTTGMRIFSSKRPSSIYSSGTFRLNIPHPIFNNRIHKQNKASLHSLFPR